MAKVNLAMVLQCIFILFISFGLTNGELRGRFSRKLQGIPTISVDKSSKSGFSSIQAAIDSVPSNNKNWISISVKAGVYNEQVKIPLDKTFIYLKGEGIGKTNVVWGTNGLTSPTFHFMADNILVSGITFVNSYNYPPSKNVNPVQPAVAAQISGDKSAFYNCSFLGYQDTLLDEQGRHYFEGCTIEGAIDFIFGYAQSIYQDCTMSVNIEALNPGLAGFIAAHGRDNPNESTGFVFKHCTVTGNGKTLLGRAWRAYSRVIYYDTFLSDIVDPVGWSAWSYVGHENNIAFAEAQCRGPGSDMSNRVKWEKTVSTQELQSLTSISYIDKEGWLSKQPQR